MKKTKKSTQKPQKTVKSAKKVAPAKQKTSKTKTAPKTKNHGVIVITLR